MIMGASQADVGVLVISARKGEFEAGFERGGQSREHAMLCKTLGISHMVVAINKMDDPSVGWAKERFDECVTKLRPFLKSCGYMIKKEVKFIPISGLGGANVKEEVRAAPPAREGVANAGARLFKSSFSLLLLASHRPVTLRARAPNRCQSPKARF